MYNVSSGNAVHTTEPPRVFNMYWPVCQTQVILENDYDYVSYQCSIVIAGACSCLGVDRSAITECRHVLPPTEHSSRAGVIRLPITSPGEEAWRLGGSEGKKSRNQYGVHTP